MQRIETARLVLRGWTTDDARDVYEYAKSANVGPNAGCKPHDDITESGKIVRMFIDDNDVWAIELKGIGKVIGSVGLHRDPYRPGVNSKMHGYVLSEKYWGHGLGTEAAARAVRFGFEQMTLSMISVYHYRHNARSRRVIEKCGFTYEGTLRSAFVIYDGSIEDAVCYSMTNEEFLSLTR